MTSLDSEILSEKVVLITGGGRGLGRAIVKTFVHHGARVATFSRTQNDLCSLAESIKRHNGLITQSFDVNNGIHGIKDFLEQVRQQWGGFDVLVNNAAIVGPPVPIHSLSSQEFRQVLRVNFGFPRDLIREIMPDMRAKGFGRVINVSTSLIQAPFEKRLKWGAYPVSKSLLWELTVSLANSEPANSGITFNAVDPLRLRTQLRQVVYPPHLDKARLYDPEKVTEVFVLLASHESAHINGCHIRAWAGHEPERLSELKSGP